VLTKQSLRKQLLAQRRAVPVPERIRAARAVAETISQTHWLAPGKRIGLYASMPQELGTLNTDARQHDFGMLEPAGDEWIGARFLDTIFCAGVGFDRRGARLGHGAGFYDRALAFRRLRDHWRGPRLVGLAYAFQVVDHIPVTPNDVFMDLIVTDRGIDELLAHEDRAIDVRSR
jgi:5-formyltetrahydrofolate cyclo-ligase